MYLILRSVAGRQAGRASRRTQGVLAALLLGLAAPAALAQEAPVPPGGGFGLPVDCPMGSLCTVQNYIDHDPGPGWRDHTCGPLSYDGHRGIDIRVPSEIEMRRGVAVIAAADGEVLIAKDGQPDLLMQDTGPGKTREERNGNWVAIRHGDGWVTTYAHMMKGSLAVREGQQVTRGEKLGLIGLSGNSDFPHVHFAVTYRNLLLDPFTGQEPSTACGEAAGSLWSPAVQAELAYRAGGLLSAGFLSRIPEKREILAGIVDPAGIAAADRVLVFFVGAWGLREGDLLTLLILKPDGTTFFRKESGFEKNQAIWTTHFGVRQNDGDLLPGEYVGFYRVRRMQGEWPATVLAVRKTVTVR
jgi:murein DD-endopeptidase MepM/ murein hydrolase activator NlpD